MKKKLIVLSGFVLSLAPVVALAAVPGPNSECKAASATIGKILCKIGDIINLLIPVLIALAVVYFVWGVISYVIGGDEAAKKSAKSVMIHGIIGLAIIVAMWGVVKVLLNTFSIENPNVITIPTVGGF